MANQSKTGAAPPHSVPDAERRRIGRVVHDDRGNASVSWQDPPADYERVVLELVPEQGTSPKSKEGCNPYAQRSAGATERTPRAISPRPSRTDLRRLSEHIKMMRELEARKRNGDDHD